MNKLAEQLMSEALKRTKLNGDFCPVALGARIGLSRAQAEGAARVLSNEGILVLGFDLSARFSPHFRKAQGPPERKVGKPARPKAARATH